MSKINHPNDFKWEKDTWAVIDAYFNQKKDQLIKHQIDSFDDFMTNKVTSVIKQYNPIIIYNDFASRITGS